jgi:hypothetical protein
LLLERLFLSVRGRQLALLGAITCLSPIVVAQSATCNGQTSQVSRASETGGVERITYRSPTSTVQVDVVRYPLADWSIRLVDMRDLRQLKARHGDYGAPTHSLAEVAALLGPNRVLSSAGMTESLVSPVPAGLLKVSGDVRNRANVSSRILDGVLCIRSDGNVKLLSDVSGGNRRIPKDIAAVTSVCRDAVQSGPMLVESGKPLIDARGKINVSRVFAGVDTEGRFVLGYSPQSTTFDLACALSARNMSISEAIMLQSDELGGIHFGGDSGFPSGSWGQVNATIASAIEVMRKGGKAQINRSSVRPSTSLTR